MADYQYGLNCIVAKVKNSKEVDLKFVLNRKQYTVGYKEKKQLDSGRNFSDILLTSDVLKASIWYVSTGAPGSKNRTWYVTDIWNPNIAGMEKSRIPEPTISIVCKITFLLGNDFFICEVGRHFTKDIIVLPRNAIHSVVKNTCPKIGDYLLVFALVIWDQLDGNKITRFVPLWAHWDSLNCTQASTAHLNIVERGPENSTLLIPDQIPCMWGVVQSVSRKSLQVFVPSLVSSVNVPKTTIFQYDNEILEEDWLQLWLTPQVGGRVDNHFSTITNWVCSNCCWFGRAKKRYEAYLEKRLAGHYVKHSAPPSVEVRNLNSVTTTTVASTKGAVVEPAPTKVPDAQANEVGVGKVLEIREKSGLLKCKRPSCQQSHVFHLGLMTLFGVKMAKIKSAKLKDLLQSGSELRYRMNPSTHELKGVWIGPEVVTFKNLNMLPQLNTWLAKKNLSGPFVQEMMKNIIESYEACAKVDAKAIAEVSNIVKEAKPTTAVVSVAEKDTKGVVPLRELGDAQDDKANDGFEEAKYSKEEEEELEKLWWSEDSDESEDELEPVLSSAGALLTTENNAWDDNGKDSKDAGKGISDLMIVAEATESLERAKDDGQLVDVVGQSSSQQQKEMPKGEGDNLENQSQSLDMGKSKKMLLMAVVLMELTKFLMEKELYETVTGAREAAADFVTRLEKSLDGITNDDLD